MLQSMPATIGAVQNVILPKVYELLRSPLLQGAALKSTGELFVTLIKAGADYNGLLTSLCGIVSSSGEEMSRSALSSVAKTTGALT